MYINKAIIYGNLTRDPELKSLPSGTVVVNFSVATNRTWKDKNGQKQEDVEYHNVVAFGRTAETINQYMKKGSGIYVEGRIQTRNWNAADGTKKYRTEIVADRIQFGPKRDGGDKSSFAKASEDKQEAPPVDTIDYPEENVNVDDIPF
ncbi:MAG: single-stranded DNA-binding protein [Candidatus Zambryskibacteria bacterium RIFCSPLOWO2_12_FULL_45_14]|uniref:Single-stranded DNA-binding protein n=2 Tax=Candidatus Zambryskiibacteriota TaxID=1817925 RepID=A0A1G2UJP5_9BACT|nr:MAG: single-stranded DNA-binding protein [Candidatus Zambryskibacteria bacterium RIFCSPLOWO2_02_FULL_44_12b]OHB13770.1 MAG: single-stranded DNA-binding protein [Candidatus Zambryskibacteria bacterium RIFCSPLOWO2_12_FULL_45_14]